jgi:hypothetical protein
LIAAKGLLFVVFEQSVDHGISIFPIN